MSSHSTLTLNRLNLRLLLLLSLRSKSFMEYLADFLVDNWVCHFDLLPCHYLRWNGYSFDEVVLILILVVRGDEKDWCVWKNFCCYGVVESWKEEARALCSKHFRQGVGEKRRNGLSYSTLKSRVHEFFIIKHSFQHVWKMSRILILL